jgi:hypothetical protein
MRVAAQRPDFTQAQMSVRKAQCEHPVSLAP